MSSGRLSSTGEMKLEIQRRVGVKNADQYFAILQRFLSCKMSKSDFDRCCIRMIGRENLSLHNSLIRAILNNARHVDEVSVKNRRLAGSLSVQVDNGYKGSCLQSLCHDGFPVSPRKGRTRTPRGRKFKEKLSPLGPLGKTPNLMSDDSPSKVLELPGATDVLSPGSRPPVEVKYVEDGEEVEQTTGTPNVQSRSPITAPYGVCIFGRESEKPLFNFSHTGTTAESCLKQGELPDTISLRSRLEEKLKEKGLDVSMDFVNCLNKGVDAYLKSLMSPTIEIAKAKSQKAVHHQQLHRTTSGPNGLLLPIRHLTKPVQPITASPLDFRVAMELNPTILGKDWPSKLEKISRLASEE